MYKMSKKNFIGRLFMLPVFVPVVVLEFMLYKAEDMAPAVHRLRVKMERFADDKFPLKDRKTNI